MIYRGIYQAFMKRGTQDVPSAKPFLTATPYHHVLMSRADALQISWKLLFEFIDDVGKTNAQRSGNFSASQNGRGAVMAFDETDRGTTDTDLIGQSLMRQALLLAEPRELIDDLFYQ